MTSFEEGEKDRAHWGATSEEPTKAGEPLFPPAAQDSGDDSRGDVELPEGTWESERQLMVPLRTRIFGVARWLVEKVVVGMFRAVVGLAGIG